jgi:hypothetical protein
MSALLDPAHDLDDEVIPCGFPTEADISGEHVEIIRCGAPSIDEDEERCAEHVGQEAYTWT